MQKILVTGANGFVGQHLVKDLSENGMEVIGVGGPQGAEEKSPYVSEYMMLDLNNPSEVKTIDFTIIDCVVHLAGLATISPSFDNPMEYINTNIGIETNLFEAAFFQNTKPKFLIISSALLYDPKAPLPLNEESAVVPSSPYGVSKLGQEQMAQYYGLRGFSYIVARPFNHIGPGQNPGFIVPDVAQQVVACEQGKQQEILVGNLDGERDYTDVRDIVRAYRLLLDKGIVGETYNICSGKAVSGHEIVTGILAAANSKAPLKQDPDKMRPSDTPLIYGSHDKLTTDTGWQPEIPLETTLADVVADWRNR